MRTIHPFLPPWPLTTWLRTIVICLTALLAASAAQAARFPLLINLGTEMFDVESTSVATGRDDLAEIVRVGYLCQHVGLFWADIWTWDCRLVQVVSEETYDDLPEVLVAALARDPRFDFDNAKRGFWNHYAFWTPFYVFGLPFGIVMAFALFQTFRPMVRRK